MYLWRYLGRESVSRVRMSGQALADPSQRFCCSGTEVTRILERGGFAKFNLTRDNSVVVVDVVQNFNFHY